MTSDTRWEPFGIPHQAWPEQPDEDGVRHLHLSMRGPRGENDRAAAWLNAAMLSLGVLAAAAAVVSFYAQYMMVYAAKGNSVIAGLEAAIPDAAAIVFASLGIALALHGKRAIRARILNVGAVATSVTMNALAAGPGWRDWAIWIMPPIAYALASDTLIGVVRAHAIAQQQESGEALAGDETTPLGVIAALMLWVLRLVVDRSGTWQGFRGWVLDECPVAPGRRALAAAPEPSTVPLSPREGTKTARFLADVEQHYGPLSQIDRTQVSRISTALAPASDLDTGAARSVLGKRVKAAQNGGHSS